MNLKITPKICTFQKFRVTAPYKIHVRGIRKFCLQSTLKITFQASKSKIFPREGLQTIFKLPKAKFFLLKDFKQFSSFQKQNFSSRRASNRFQASKIKIFPREGLQTNFSAQNPFQTAFKRKIALDAWFIITKIFSEG